METGANFEQGSDASLDFDLSTGRGGDTGEDFQESGFASAVAPDDAKDFTLLHLEGDVLQSPEGWAVLVFIVGLPDFEERVGFATNFRPPDFEVAREGAGADLAEAVGFT
jgi:hypothetical protein